MTWQQGYVSDIEYTSGFYRELAPSHLAQALSIKNVVSPNSSGAFNYCELACGFGFTTQILAAANPQANFVGIDFNPAHIVAARQLSSEAGLENITFHDDSFADLNAKTDSSTKFDFITLHGTYSWVSVANRRQIRNFVRDYLAPGGVVYVSYNSLPGWAPMAPVQRLIRDFALSIPQKSDRQAERSVKFIDRVKTANARYFSANPSIEARIQKLQTANSSYLAHEYLNREWHPLFHSDVAQEFSDAKLSYAASATLAENFPAVLFSEEQRGLLAEIEDELLAETVKDFFLNQQFRRDIFVRGVCRYDQQTQMERIKALCVSLLVPRSEASLKMQFSIGEVNGNPDIYNPILDELASGPKTIADLLIVPSLRSFNLSSVYQAVVVLCATAQLAIRNAQIPVLASARKLNEVISRRAHLGDTYQALAAPAIGNGISTSLVDRLTYAAIADGIDERGDLIAKYVLSSLKRRNQILIHNGKELTNDFEHLEVIEPQVDTIVVSKLPLWRDLGVL